MTYIRAITFDGTVHLFECQAWNDIRKSELPKWLDAHLAVWKGSLMHFGDEYASLTKKTCLILDIIRK